jgi:chaperonin GroEL
MVKTAFGNDLKKKLLNGINSLNASVSSTLGPGGRNVLISDENGNIKVTKDGVTVAKSFNKLEDEVENIGAQMIRKVSEKSADKAGDGTTTSTLIAAVIVNEGVKAIDQGSNPVEVKRGIDLAVKEVVKALKELSQDITDEDQIKQVATISANNDVEVGKLIAAAMNNVGRDGLVAIEESKSGETTLETVEGMMFERGYKSPYFVTNQNTMEAVLEKPYVFLYDGKMNTTAHVLNVLKAAASESRPLLIIAEDVDVEALALLIVNKANNTIKVCAVKAPDFGDRRTAILEDMAIITGGRVISPVKGDKIDKMTLEQVKSSFGTVRMATVTSKDTTLIDGGGTEEAITNRLKEIKSQIDLAKSNFEIENLQGRLSKLEGGVAIINVGGYSEIELKEKKDRVDDALHATKAALEQGIVPGGGMALINCASAIDKVTFQNNDQKLGGEIIKKALYAPFKTILNNAGIEDHYQILNQIKVNNGSEKKWEGYDVKNGTFVNLLVSGILDPTKVTRTALENAASVAGTILTTESVVYNVGEKKNEEIDYSQFM